MQVRDQGMEDDEHSKDSKDGVDILAVLEQLKDSPLEDDLSLSLVTLGRVFNELHSRWTVAGDEEEKQRLWHDPIARACERYGKSIVFTDKSGGDAELMTMSDLYAAHKLEEVHVKKATDMELFLLIQLQYKFSTEDLLTGAEEPSGDVDLAEVCGDASELRLKISRVQRAIVSNKYMLISFVDALRTHCGSNDFGAPSIMDPFAYSIYDPSSKFTPYQELTLFILRELRRSHLRRSKDKLIMRPLMTKLIPHPVTGEPQRFNTCSWVPEVDDNGKPLTFLDFIASRVSLQTQENMWKHMTTANNMEKLAKYLEVCNEDNLPTLRADSTHISFSNGVLELATGTLLLYPIVKANSIVSMNYIDQPCPSNITLQHLVEASEDGSSNPAFYERDNSTEERTARVASIIDWRDLMGVLDDIETPTLDGIFTMQLDRDETSEFWDPKNMPAGSYLREFARLKFWHYALLGRLLYEVGDRDNWQVVQFLKGVAGSGKSTLCNLVKWFFRAEDVGTLNNQMRGGGNAIGGLMDVYKAKVWMCTEVDQNFQLPRVTWQSMVCGEYILIDVLNTNSINWRWRSHGLMAGNKFFGYKDTSGSVTRRVLNTDFNKPIPDGAKDPELEKKLRKELSCIIYKSVLAYLYLTCMYKGCDIWNIVPYYFKWTREKLSAACDPLGAFIKACIGSGELVKDPSRQSGMLWSKLREMFMSSDFKKNDLKPADYKDIASNDFQQIRTILTAMDIKLLQVTPRTHDEAEDLLANGDGDLSKWTKESQNFYVIVGLVPNRNI
jgi:hypothetical protein